MPMSTHRQIDEPSPTIVGPRPAEGAGGKFSIPQGLERLLTLAGISTEWRSKVLADPFGAAAEAGIGLSASERAILKAVPRSALEAMAGSFARKHGSSAVVRYATGAVAAAALLATGIAYGGDSPATKGGVRADDPEPKRPVGMETEGGVRPDVPEDAKPVLWMTALDDGLAQARKGNRAVMAVFLFSAKASKDNEQYLVPMAGVMAVRESQEEKSQKICLSDDKEMRAAVKNADLIAVKLARPVKPREMTKDDSVEDIARLEAERKAYEKANKSYLEAFEKYGLDEKKLPAVVFLAPDGTEFAKLVQPDQEAKLLEGIKATPPQLAKWITEQRRRLEPPGAGGGIRADKPATQGIRPDIPEEKL
jgi:hypothetical protein